MTQREYPPLRDLRSENPARQAAAEAYWPVVPFADDQTSICCGVRKQWRMRLDVAQDRSKADANCLSEACGYSTCARQRLSQLALRNATPTVA